MNEREAASMIFSLRKKSGLYLRAGDTEQFNRIQCTIAHLQRLYGCVQGQGEDKDNDPRNR